MTNTIVFWLIVVLLLGGGLALLLPGLLRRAEDSRRASRNELNAEVYRRQIDDLDRELAEGSLDAGQHAAAREELQRRLLADVQAAQAAPMKQQSPRWVAVLIAVGLPLVALGLYTLRGSPSAVPMGPATPVPGLLVGETPPAGMLPTRPSIEQLQEHLAREPRDGRAWIMLARALADGGNWPGAVSAYEKALGSSRKVARDPGVLIEYADVLGMSQGGRLAGKPEVVIKEALLINGRHPRALEMAGSLAYEKGDFVAAANYWQDLLEQLQPGTQMHAELSAAIDKMRAMSKSQ